MKKLKTQLTILVTRLLQLVFIHKRHQFDPQSPKILIICTTALGDNIWSAPTLAAIKQQYPTAYVAYLTSPVGKAILQHDPHIDEFFVLSKDRYNEAIKLWKQLRQKHFQFIYVPHVSQRSMVPMACLLGAEKVVGIEKNVKQLEPLFDAIVDNPLDRHLIITRLLGLSHIDITPPQNPQLKLYWTQNDKAQAQSFLKNSCPKPMQLTVILQVGASKPNRLWQADKFIALGQWLIQNYDCNIIVAGGPKEKNRVLQIQKAIPQAAAVYGQLDLPAYSALIKLCTLMITTDTGPMHMASATQTPLVVLLGNANAALYGPFNTGIIELIRSPIDSKGPEKHNAPQRYVDQIPLTEMQDACDRVLQQFPFTVVPSKDE